MKKIDMFFNLLQYFSLFVMGVILTYRGEKLPEAMTLFALTSVLIELRKK